MTLRWKLRVGFPFGLCWLHSEGLTIGLSIFHSRSLVIFLSGVHVYLMIQISQVLALRTRIYDDGSAWSDFWLFFQKYAWSYLLCLLIEWSNSDRLPNISCELFLILYGGYKRQSIIISCRYCVFVHSIRLSSPGLSDMTFSTVPAFYFAYALFMM